MFSCLNVGWEGVLSRVLQHDTLGVASKICYYYRCTFRLQGVVSKNSLQLLLFLKILLEKKWCH